MVTLFFQSGLIEGGAQANCKLSWFVLPKTILQGQLEEHKLKAGTNFNTILQLSMIEAFYRLIVLYSAIGWLCNNLTLGEAIFVKMVIFFHYQPS